MGRQRQQPRVDPLVGQQVRGPLRLWPAWAQQRFPDTWETGYLRGAVIAVGGPGSLRGKPVVIKWENGDTEAFSHDYMKEVLLTGDL